MTLQVTLLVVLAATYGLVSSLMSVVVAATWHLCLKRVDASANELLALRLAPAGAAALVSLAVTLPAFLTYEPTREFEDGGPLLLALASIALLSVGIGMGRAWRASSAAVAFLKACGPALRESVVTGRRVDVIDVPDPIVAVVGGLQPRIVASTRVISACTDDEFEQIVAHERAHVSARDNLKLWLFFFGPDLLAWLPAGVALAVHWRAAAEREADERATGAHSAKRVALASALVKVARLAMTGPSREPALSMPVGADDVDARVRRLLAAPAPPRRSQRLWALAAGSLLIPAIGVPFYGPVQQLIEAVVAFGR